MPANFMRIVLHCLRCEHDWVRRNLKQLPVKCPACNSPYWDRPRQKDLATKVDGPSPFRPPSPAIEDKKPLSKAKRKGKNG